MISPEVAQWTHTDGTQAVRCQNGNLWIQDGPRWRFVGLARENMTASRMLRRIHGPGWGGVKTKRERAPRILRAGTLKRPPGSILGRVAAYHLRAEQFHSANRKGMNPSASITDLPLTDAEIAAALHVVGVIDLPRDADHDFRQTALLQSGACLTRHERDEALAEIGLPDRQKPMDVPTGRFWQPHGRRAE